MANHRKNNKLIVGELYEFYDKNVNTKEQTYNGFFHIAGKGFLHYDIVFDIINDDKPYVLREEFYFRSEYAKLIFIESKIKYTVVNQQHQERIRYHFYNTENNIVLECKDYESQILKFIRRVS